MQPAGFEGIPNAQAGLYFKIKVDSPTELNSNVGVQIYWNEAYGNETALGTISTTGNYNYAENPIYYGQNNPNALSLDQTAAFNPYYFNGPDDYRITVRVISSNQFEWTTDITSSGQWNGPYNISLGAPFPINVINSSPGNNVNVSNCLFEKNTVTLTGTATQNDYQQVPLIYIKASTSTARNVMQNCIVRSNQVTIDYSATALTSVNNARGLIVAIECHATYPTTLKNTIIHNNDMTFIPKTGATNSLGNAGAVTNYAAANSQSDSIINCTIAKNKGTAINKGTEITTNSNVFFNPCQK
jgi:hypothetical protein